MSEPASRGFVSEEFERTSRSPVLNLLRAIFLVLLVVFTSLLIVTDSATPGGGLSLVKWWPLAVLGTLLFFAGVISIDFLIPKRKLSTITAIFVGLIAGVVVTAILGLVIDLFGEIYNFGGAKLLEPFKILLGVGVCYLTISSVLQTQDDFRLVIPYVEFSKKIRGSRPLLIDTSALIDGRILDVARTGLFQSSLIVPRYVIEELQRLGDSQDRVKRARGRRGLDTMTKLQSAATVDVKIEETMAPPGTVDSTLIEQARNLPAIILTTDSGLARVAVIQGASVVNLHDLASALKPAATPGETLMLRIIRRGEQPGQGVGFLDDGTMVVVEDGQHAIGSEMGVTVTGTMQTNAGRLVFARIDASSEPHDDVMAPAEEAPGTGDQISPAETSERALPPRVVEVPSDSPSRSRPGPLGPGRSDGGGGNSGGGHASRGSRNPRRG